MDNSAQLKKLSEAQYVSLILFVTLILNLIFFFVIGVFDSKSYEAIEEPKLGAIQKVFPDKCWANSELAEGWSCESLLDTQFGYDELHWEDNSDGCSLAELKFYFNEEVFIEFVVFKNLDDEVLFNRNFKIKTAWVTFNEDDVVSNIFELKNEQGSQWLDINKSISSIGFEVVSAYPGIEFNGASPFLECALQEVSFYGRLIDGA